MLFDSPRLALGGLAAAAVAVPIGIASADSNARTNGDALTAAACGGELAGDPFVRTELSSGCPGREAGSARGSSTDSSTRA